jgi:hypothetical protein
MRNRSSDDHSRLGADRGAAGRWAGVVEVEVATTEARRDCAGPALANSDPLARSWPNPFYLCTEGGGVKEEV